jgi:hypothetical protein
MLISAGLLLMLISAIAYAFGLAAVGHYYNRSFSSSKPKEPLWQIASHYQTIVSWCLDEGTMPGWAPRIVQWATMGFVAGLMWSILAAVF